ncbi:MAG TPA: DoxX family protein [Caulobacteraceae bacterium]|nr:DoxX family protein [Caulobacteraceae bacterium]
MTSQPLAGPLAAPINRAIALLDRIPYGLIALIARAATCTVFWSSGTQKLSDWSATLALFETEYHVPLIPPHPAAYMATTIEIGCAVLVMAGLATRAAVFVLLGMTTVIEVFIYPGAWPTHIQWVAFMFVLLARGPGKISLDALIGPKLLGAKSA